MADQTIQIQNGSDNAYPVIQHPISVIDIDLGSVTFAANEIKWINVSVPSGYRYLGYAGYQLNTLSSVIIYVMRPESIACRNMASNGQSGSIVLRMLVEKI